MTALVLGTFRGSDLVEDSGFASRLKQVIESFGGTSALARSCGVSESVVRKWRDGISEPTRSRLVAIADAANVSVEWLATGNGPMHSPRFNLTKNISPHATPEEAQDGMMSIINAFMDSWKAQADATKPRCMGDVMQGDMMEPSLRDNDLLIVDLSDADPHQISSGVYRFTLGTEAHVARFQRLPGDTLQVVYDNQKYSPFTITLSNIPNDFIIIGRVIWAGSSL